MSFVKKSKRPSKEPISSRPSKEPAKKTQPPPKIVPPPSDPLPTPSRILNEEEPMETNGEGGVVFVRPIVLQPIPSVPDNVTQIQLGIDNFKMYLNALHNNVHNKRLFSLKDFFIINNELVSELKYKHIMQSIIKFQINSQNFLYASNMFYEYYIKLFDIIGELAHIIVNVNYTHNSTRISELLTLILNKCALYYYESIMDLIVEKSYSSTQYYNIIEQNQSRLTNLFNIKLVSLQNILFYKHTVNNDINKKNTYSRTTIIDIPIKVIFYKYKTLTF
jgi:hypothetical protein